jgi:hypothetical protein
MAVHPRSSGLPTRPAAFSHGGVVVRAVCGRMLMAFASLVWASTPFRDPERLIRQLTKLSAFGGDRGKRGLRRSPQQGNLGTLRQ